MKSYAWNKASGVCPFSCGSPPTTVSDDVECVEDALTVTDSICIARLGSKPRSTTSCPRTMECLLDLETSSTTAVSRLAPMLDTSTEALPRRPGGDGATPSVQFIIGGALGTVLCVLFGLLCRRQRTSQSCRKNSVRRIRTGHTCPSP